MKVIHIGLGKTATTTLQRSIFPYLEEIGIIDSYNDPELMQTLRKSVVVDLSAEERNRFTMRMSELGSIFISLESLVAWDPANWEKAANTNFDLLGADATIIITIREPLSYLTSLYQQIVHQGNVKKPEDFFLRNDEYQQLFSSNPVQRLNCINIDLFDLERLISLYKKKFSRVVVVPIEKMGEMRFLDSIYHLDNAITRKLSHRFKNAQRHNISYSNLAMKITFLRERFLRLLGLKSIGSEDFNLKNLRRLYNNQINAVQKNSFKELPLQDKPKRIFTVLFIRFFQRLQWRFFIQNFFDKVVPYRKYKLPDGLIPESVLIKNKALYKKCLEEAS